MIINKLRKILAAAALTALVMLLPACGEDKPDYEALKTDILGVWCDVTGPEYVENNGNPYYRMYEFTPDNQIIYHMPQALGSVYNESSYEIRDDILNVDGARCRISIENDILTMTFDGGQSQYRRMTLEEVCDYGVVCITDELYKQQLVILEMVDETAAPDSGASLETASEEASDTAQ